MATSNTSKNGTHISNESIVFFFTEILMKMMQGLNAAHKKAKMMVGLLSDTMMGITTNRPSWDKVTIYFKSIIPSTQIVIISDYFCTWS